MDPAALLQPLINWIHSHIAWAATSVSSSDLFDNLYTFLSTLPYTVRSWLPLLNDIWSSIWASIWSWLSSLHDIWSWLPSLLSAFHVLPALLLIIALLTALIALFFLSVHCELRLRRQRHRRRLSGARGDAAEGDEQLDDQLDEQREPLILGFFHPYWYAACIV